MNITRITDENAEYFRGLVPDKLLNDKEMLHIGGVSDDGDSCGVLTAVMEDEMVSIEWLFVAPDYRRRGIGTELLETLVLILKRIQARGIEIFFANSDEGIEEFLTEVGFLVSGDTCTYSVPVRDLIYSFTMDRIIARKTISGRLFTLKQMADWTALEEYLARKGIDASHLEIITPECSFVRMNDKNEIRGCLLIDMQTEDQIQVTWLVNDDFTKGIEELFRMFRDIMLKYNLEDEKIIFVDREGNLMDWVEQVAETDREHYRRTVREYGVRLLNTAGM